MPSIGIRYCGGCNPQIDRSRVIRRLKEGLEKRAFKATFATDKKKAVDIVLLVNGCMHACLQEEYLRSNYNYQHISVKGEMVDNQYIEEESIPGLLIKKIMDLYQLLSY